MDYNNELINMIGALFIILALAIGAGFGISGVIAAGPEVFTVRVLLIEFYEVPVQRAADISLAE